MEKTKLYIILIAAIVVVIVFLIIFLPIYFFVIAAGEDCDDAKYRDIETTKHDGDEYCYEENDEEICYADAIKFYQENEYIDSNMKMEIYDVDGESVIGEFNEIYLASTAGREFTFSLRNDQGEMDIISRVYRNVIGWSYKATNCDESGDTYYIDQNFAIGERSFTIYKNGDDDEHIIAESTSSIFAADFRPDITIVDTDDNLMAYLGRGLNPFFTSKWEVVNVQPDKIPNFIVGFMGYIVYLDESSENN